MFDYPGAGFGVRFFDLPPKHFAVHGISEKYVLATLYPYNLSWVQLELFLSIFESEMSVLNAHAWIIIDRSSESTFTWFSREGGRKRGHQVNLLQSGSEFPKPLRAGDRNGKREREGTFAEQNRQWDNDGCSQKDGEFQLGCQFIQKQTQWKEGLGSSRQTLATKSYNESLGARDRSLVVS